MSQFSQSFSWLIQMAWRDSRRNLGRLFLFTSSIILGVAALVAIDSFSRNLWQDIDNQAKSLLGADLSVSSRRAFSQEAILLLDSLGGEQASENTFPSMAYFPRTEDGRLVQIRALEGNYPFYGELKTFPANIDTAFRSQQRALVDRNLMLQFDAEIGDSIRVGSMTFEIAGHILQVPGSNLMSSMVTSPVYIPMEYLDRTNLIQKGSRVRYQRYFKFEDGKDVEGMMEGMKDRFRALDMGFDTVEERRSEVGEAFENLGGFLNLVAFIALLLGCVGVASSIHIYVREKIESVAILRCLGSSGTSAMLIYLLQIALMGLIGSIIGSLIGSQIQQFLPVVLGSFLPVEATVKLSWPSIGFGIVVGMLIAILFALLPLLEIRKVSPLYALRAAYESKSGKRDPIRWLVMGGILLFVYIFSFWQLESWIDALAFTGYLVFAFLILAGGAKLTMWLTRRYFPVKWNYLWRQSLANLYRPNNQTLVLMIAIGLGTGMISTLVMVQNLLLSTVEISAEGSRPNMVLFDIQAKQLNSLDSLATLNNIEVQQQVPVVSMRLASMNGRSREELIADTTDDVSRGTLNREYRITFRDSLIDSEEIIEGEWVPYVRNDSVFISLEEGFGKRSMKAKLGDEIVFDVQGRKITTYVGSFRKVDWQRVQTNFLVLFPIGVLEEAPQFHVMIARTESVNQSASFQRAVMRNYANVSILDLDLIISTAEKVLNQASFVIRFMSLFSILTGLLVLVGSVIVSKYQRMQESVLLRTLGASRRQILLINALEYFLLGMLASGIGVLLSLVATWGLAIFSFEMIFVPQLLPALGMMLVITALSVFIGLMNSREVVNLPPLEVLRKE